MVFEVCSPLCRYCREGFLTVMLQSLPSPRADSTTTTQEIIGESRAIKDVLSQVRQFAHTSATVMINGETGVGKELVASYIHSGSPRYGRPFIAVNCAGLPETLLESELFGHVKGSFTGAYRDKPGKFELAHTGTLFLDEVGEMTPRMQGLLAARAREGRDPEGRRRSRGRRPSTAGLSRRRIATWKKWSRRACSGRTCTTG